MAYWCISLLFFLLGTQFSYHVHTSFPYTNVYPQIPCVQLHETSEGKNHQPTLFLSLLLLFRTCVANLTLTWAHNMLRAFHFMRWRRLWSGKNNFFCQNTSTFPPWKSIDQHLSLLFFLTNKARNEMPIVTLNWTIGTISKVFAAIQEWHIFCRFQLRFQ